MPRESHSMERTEKKSFEALAWLCYVLNPDMEMPVVTDWPALIAFARKQALTGVCMPPQRPVNLGQGQLLEWIGQVQLIEQRNNLLNKRIDQLFGTLEQAGFDCCLLKGQGNAEMYPNPLVRCSGDIDVWIDADEDKVYQYVRDIIPYAEESFKHIHFPIFKDVPVDIHSMPLRFYSGHFRKKLEQWISLNKAEQFAHKIKLTGIEREVSAPTRRFNAVYQMGHMLIHTFDEGVGLRQVVDYYYVLKGLEITEGERIELEVTLRELGMYKFARAIMWIETHLLGLPDDRCIVEQDSRIGDRLLKDILEGGNFGHHSEQYSAKRGFYYRGVVEAFRDMKWFVMAPREVTARLFNKVGTAFRHARNRKNSRLEQQ